MNIDLRQTLARIHKDCRTAGVNSLVVCDLPGIQYLTECVASSPGDIVALVKPSKVVVFTDSRYAGTVRRAIGNNPLIEPVIWDRPTQWDYFFSKVPKGSRLGFEKVGSSTSYDFVQTLRKNGRKHGVGVSGVNTIIIGIRSIKSPAEIKLLRQAGAISDEAFRRIVGHIKPGVTELEISQLLGIELRELSGCEDLSFGTTVASGPNGAYPHAGATNREICMGDMVTLDFGCIYRGYHADVTRTVFVGRMEPRKSEIYNLVRDAQRAAQSQARPGMTGQDIDRIARSMITDSKYGQWCYGHATGHGVGLNVHELPYLSHTAPGANVLEEGSVFSIEPGIYIDGECGVRIENTGVLTKRGFKSFTTSSTNALVVH